MDHCGQQVSRELPVFARKSAGRAAAAVRPADHRNVTLNASDTARMSDAPCGPVCRSRTIARMAEPKAPPAVWKILVEMLAWGTDALSIPVYAESIMAMNSPPSPEPRTSSAAARRTGFVSGAAKANGSVPAKIAARLRRHGSGANRSVRLPSPPDFW